MDCKHDKIEYKRLCIFKYEITCMKCGFKKVVTAPVLIAMLNKRGQEFKI